MPRLVPMTRRGAIAAMLVAGVPLPAMAQGLPAVAAPSTGTAWYPEQWPEARWNTDLALMKRANLKWVRLAEFSWSTLEPREGDYRLDWLERAVRAAERHGLKVVLGTPSAAPPAWLTAKYPDVLRVERGGRRVEHGYRAHFNWSSPRYRLLAAKVVARMADRFGRDPNVVGWQIDNEYDEESYGADDRARFQDWLRARFRSLDTLNARWTTAYWSQTYTDWRQIPIPGETGANPGLALAWRRFVTDEWRAYQKAQTDVLRATVEARQRITTNLLGLRERFDLAAITGDLDFASWDYYVGTGHFDPRSNGFYHDLVRGLLGRPFWIMETQPGQVNWAGLNNMPDRGELRAMAWAAVGHGADAIGYWQWRPALNGQEQYHGALLNAGGEPAPVLAEVAAIGAEFDRVAPALAGTAIRSDVAVLHDYSSRWAWNGQRHHRDFDPVAVIRRTYDAARRVTGAVDVVPPTTTLNRYRVVFAPALHLLTPEIGQRLRAYVQGGGHLVLGARSGMKDEENALWPSGQPGPVADLLGARVSQFYALERPVELTGAPGAGRALLWADTLEMRAPDVEVLLRYGKANGWIDDQPAAVLRRVGKGSIAYVGADLDEVGVTRLVATTLTRAGLRASLPAVPDTVDVSVREDEGRRVYVFVADGKASGEMALPRRMRDLLTGATVERVRLSPYAVAVLEERTR